MKQVLSIRLIPELIKILRELAKKDNRSLSNYIENIFKEHVERKTGRTGT